MKYFIDTEFIEGFHKPLFGKKRYFIDLISIGIVCEDGREYYATSKDFDLKAAWNACDLKPDIDNGGMKKDYWLRENVLKPIWDDFRYGFNPVKHDIFDMHLSRFTYDNFKTLLKKYGKSNKKIAKEIIEFVNSEKVQVVEHSNLVTLSEESQRIIKQGYTEPEFYGYFADYDWVLFCSLFGRMIDLPNGFQMYCNDLKQMLDEKEKSYNILKDENLLVEFKGILPENNIKLHPDYPKQSNEHNALADAKWNKELYNFLTNLW